MDQDTQKQRRSERRRSFAIRLVVAGFAVAALSLVVAGAAGNTHAVFQWFVPSLIGLVVAGAVFVTGRLFVPAAVVASLLLAIYALGGSMELGHPLSFPDFVPAFWRAAGALVAFVGAIVGVAGRARGDIRRPTPRQRLVGRAAAALLIVVTGISFALTSAAQTTVRNADGAIEVVTQDDVFEPDIFELERGERVKFLVRNTDSYAHTFTVDDLAVDVYVGPRTERLVTFDVDVPSGTGTRGMVLSCAVTGHDDMLGTIRVQLG